MAVVWRLWRMEVKRKGEDQRSDDAADGVLPQWRLSRGRPMGTRYQKDIPRGDAKETGATSIAIVPAVQTKTINSAT